LPWHPAPRPESRIIQFSHRGSLPPKRSTERPDRGVSRTWTVDALHGAGSMHGA
jgi:hypothetical protein